MWEYLKKCSSTRAYLTLIPLSLLPTAVLGPILLGVGILLDGTDSMSGLVAAAFCFGYCFSLGMVARALQSERENGNKDNHHYEKTKAHLTLLFAFGGVPAAMLSYEALKNKDAPSTDPEEMTTSFDTGDISDSASGLSIDTELAIILTAVAAVGMLALFAYNKLGTSTSSLYRPGESTTELLREPRTCLQSVSASERTCGKISTSTLANARAL